MLLEFLIRSMLDLPQPPEDQHEKETMEINLVKLPL